MSVRFKAFISIIFLVLIMMLSSFMLSCSDDEAARKNHYEMGVLYLEDNEIKRSIIEFKKVIQNDPGHADAYFNLGHAYLKMSKVDPAIDNLEKAIELKTSFEKQSFYLLAWAYLAKKEIDKSLSSLAILHKENPDDPGILDFIGYIYAESKDFRKAKDHFKKALQIDDTLVSALVNIGKLFLIENQFQDARRNFDKALEIDPGNLSALYYTAELLYHQKKNDEAIQKCLDIISMDPQQFPARVLVSYLYLISGKYPELKKHAVEIKKHWPKATEGYFFNGVALMAQNNIDEAIAELTNALKYDHSNADTHYLLSIANYKIQYYETAISDVNKSFKFEPGLSMANIVLAATYLNKGWYDEAIVESTKVLQAYPQNVPALKIIGTSYILNGQYGRGLQKLSQAMGFDQELDNMYLSLGDFGLREAKSDEAVETPDTAAKTNPENTEVRLRLVLTYLNEKKFDKAILSCKNGLRINPQNAILYNLMGMAHLKKNDEEKAFELFERALEIDPGLTAHHYIIANYYLKQKDTEKALQQYRLVLKKNSEDTNAIIAIARILEKDGRIDKAVQLYKKINKGENAIEALTSLSNFYLRNKDYERAITAAQEAMKLNMNVPQVYYLLGAAYAGKRDSQSAAEHFQKLRELNPLSSLRHYHLGIIYI